MKIYTDFTVEELLDKKLDWNEEEVKTFLEDVLDYCLNNCSISDAIDVFESYNEEAEELQYDFNAVKYFNDNHYYNVYNMDEFNDLFSDCKPWDLARDLDSDFNPYDDWFQIDDLNHISSGESLSDLICEYDDFINTLSLIIDLSSEILEKLERWQDVENKENLRNECGDLMFQ